MAGGYDLPVFVSPEVGEGETPGHLQGVSVLRRQRQAAERGGTRRKHRHQQGLSSRHDVSPPHLKRCSPMFVRGG
jgi:hypothetical protein